MKEEYIPKKVNIGDKMPDGSVFVGFSIDANYLFAAPQDLGVAMTFNDAAKQIEKLNAENYLDHNDWRIPPLIVLGDLYHYRDAGALEGTFNKEAEDGSGSPVGYWASAEFTPGNHVAVRFSPDRSKLEFTEDKDNAQFHCRPLRVGPSLFKKKK